MRAQITSWILLVFGCVPLFVFLNAHSGKLNSDQCHNDKANNEYHCHQEEATKESPSARKSSSNKYDRSSWGSWSDEDGDCQKLRHEILITSSEVPVVFKSNKKCQVRSGKWFDVYSGKYFGLADQMEIDHVVAVKEAWLSGGKNWDQKMKREFYNDTDNLLPVSRTAHRPKGAQDIAQWLPPKAFQCDYLKIWLKVKSKYALTFDKREKRAISRLKKSCPVK